MSNRAPDSGKRKLRMLPRVVSAYAVSGAVVSLALSLVDHGVRGPAQPRWLPHAAGVGWLSGLLSGLSVGLALFFLGLLRGWALRAVVLLAGCAAWVFVALTELGVLARLTGPHATLAWAALSAIVALALGGMMLALALTPELSAEPAQASLFGAALGRTPRLRWTSATVMLVITVGAVAADALLFPEQYAFIHQTLRRVARWSLLLLPLLAGLPQRWLTIAALATSLTVAVALFMLDEARSAVVSAMRAAPFVELALDDLRALGDSDADGFAVWLGGGDCAPLDHTVHPNAQEIPGNGLDDNCRLGDLPAPVQRAAPVLQQPRPGPATPSLVLITIDTLRADHLSSYGYGRNTSPNIDAYFAKGTRYADAVAAGAFTTISIPSLLRGVSPRRLHWTVARQTNHFRLFPARMQPALRPNEQWLNAHLLCLDMEHPPIAAMLAKLGFVTWAVVDDGGSAFLSQPLVGQGFEHFAYVPGVSGKMMDPEGDAQTARLALQALAARDGRPFFLWVHFYGVHAPDAVHAGVPSFGDDMVARYDHEIAYVDAQLAPVFSLLEQIEKETPLVVALTADHGERFSRQGRAHGSNLVEDEIRVPLFVRGTGVPAKVEPAVVSLLDVVPTLLVQARVSNGKGFDGIDLLSGAELAKRSEVLVDVWSYDAAGRSEFERVGVVSREFRLVFEAATNSRRLYRRGKGGGLVLEKHDELERAAALYLEHTGPQPATLLP